MSKPRWLLPVKSQSPYTLIGFCLLVGCGSPGGPEPVAEQAADNQTNAEASSEETASMTITEPPGSVELAPLPEPDGTESAYSISQVMQLAHQNKLYRKLLDPPVDAEVAERLMLLYSALPLQDSPKGDQDDWRDRAQALADGAKKVIAGEEDGVAAFRRAVNCNSCHSRHRP